MDCYGLWNQRVHLGSLSGAWGRSVSPFYSNEDEPRHVESIVRQAFDVLREIDVEEKNEDIKDIEDITLSNMGFSCYLKYAKDANDAKDACNAFVL